MKKIIIGLLVIAASVTVFYFANNRTSDKPDQEKDVKELIVGKWKAISLDDFDSLSVKYYLTFNKNGTLIRSQSDEESTDTSSYKWVSATEIQWSENAKDTTGRSYKIIKLTKDSLEFHIIDSIFALFIKQ